MSEEKQNEQAPVEHSVSNLETHPSTEGRSAADVWREECKIVEVS